MFQAITEQNIFCEISNKCCKVNLELIYHSFRNFCPASVQKKKNQARSGLMVYKYISEVKVE